MTNDIIKDRLEIEKMAIDAFIKKRYNAWPVDFADLEKSKEYTTFNYAFVCRTTLDSEFSINIFTMLEGSLIDDRRFCFMNMIVNPDDDMAPYLEEIEEVFRLLEHFNAEYSMHMFNVSDEIPSGEIEIRFMFARNKADADFEEDEHIREILQSIYQPHIDLPSFSTDF